MSRVTKFAGRDPGSAARVAGFVAHLRENGLRLGVAEADLAMAALSEVNAIRPDDSRRALRACLLYTSPSPRDQRGSRMPSSA